MPDHIMGTEQEHITELFNSIRYGMCPQPEQVIDIAVAVRIKTIRGTCQDLGKRPRGDIKIFS